MALKPEMRELLRTELRMPEQPVYPKVKMFLSGQEGYQPKLLVDVPCLMYGNTVDDPVIKCLHSDCQISLGVEYTPGQTEDIISYCPRRRIRVRVDSSTLKVGLCNNHTTPEEIRELLLKKLTRVERLYLEKNY